jgi:hydrogenase maturation protease
MSLTDPAPVRIVVLGLGNTLLGDEGLGVRALHALRERVGDTYPEIEWVDGGTSGLEALACIEGRSHLLLLDAVQTGAAPGTLIRLTSDEIPATIALKLSMHEVVLADALALSALRGTLPGTRVLLGIVPEVIDWGEDLSTAVGDAMGALIAASERELRTWMKVPQET